ncbi:hypothetical protein OIDMADRAFT_177034 [Oidiodendron maius Zn]|uniref:Uncharacterized protein n=1 Tax=Oidiodendron maius (strain Zn) TaxID=913774 RepID=A0A0C3H8V3_OIDMZ|nr:hypothetical protein OIDMADRAFT_177034 [Oidiodendron maius Zn]
MQSNTFKRSLEGTSDEGGGKRPRNDMQVATAKAQSPVLYNPNRLPIITADKYYDKSGRKGFPVNCLLSDKAVLKAIEKIASMERYRLWPNDFDDKGYVRHDRPPRGHPGLTDTGEIARISQLGRADILLSGDLSPEKIRKYAKSVIFVPSSEVATSAVTPDVDTPDGRLNLISHDTSHLDQGVVVLGHDAVSDSSGGSLGDTMAQSAPAGYTIKCAEMGHGTEMGDGVTHKGSPEAKSLTAIDEDPIQEMLKDDDNTTAARPLAGKMPMATPPDQDIYIVGYESDIHDCPRCGWPAGKPPLQGKTLKNYRDPAEYVPEKRLPGYIPTDEQFSYAPSVAMYERAQQQQPLTNPSSHLSESDRNHIKLRVINARSYQEGSRACQEAHRIVDTLNNCVFRVGEILKAVRDGSATKEWLEEALEDIYQVYGGNPYQSSLHKRNPGVQKMLREVDRCIEWFEWGMPTALEKVSQPSIGPLNAENPGRWVNALEVVERPDDVVENGGFFVMSQNERKQLISSREKSDRWHDVPHGGGQLFTYKRIGPEGDRYVSDEDTPKTYSDSNSVRHI